MLLNFKYNDKEFKIKIGEIGESSDDPLPSTLGELRNKVSQETGCEIKTMKLIKKGFFLF
jgi:hypothetical protein